MDKAQQIIEALEYLLAMDGSEVPDICTVEQEIKTALGVKTIWMTSIKEVHDGKSHLFIHDTTTPVYQILEGITKELRPGAFKHAHTVSEIDTFLGSGDY